MKHAAIFVQSEYGRDGTEVGAGGAHADQPRARARRAVPD
jgi:hypothetical protein